MNTKLLWLLGFVIGFMLSVNLVWAQEQGVVFGEFEGNELRVKMYLGENGKILYKTNHNLMVSPDGKITVEFKEFGDKWSAITPAEELAKEIQAKDFNVRDESGNFTLNGLQRAAFEYAKKYQFKKTKYIGEADFPYSHLFITLGIVIIIGILGIVIRFRAKKRSA